MMDTGEDHRPQMCHHLCMSDGFATQPNPGGNPPGGAGVQSRPHPGKKETQQAPPPPPPPPPRTASASRQVDENLTISAIERELAQERLREAVVSGALSLDEYGDRLEQAMSATTRRQLREAVDGLPESDFSEADLQDSGEPARVARPAPTRNMVIGVMGGDEAKGRWRPAPTTTAVGVMGGADLDLRYAEFDGDVLTINAFALMGGVEIVVPDGVEVTMSGLAFMGGRTCKVHGGVDPAAPIVHVRAYALMGGVDVRQANRRERKREERDGTGLVANATPLRGGSTASSAYRRPPVKSGQALGQTRERVRQASERSNMLGRLFGGLLVAAALALPASWIVSSDDVAATVFGSNDTTVSAQELEDGSGSYTVTAAPLFGSVVVEVPEGVVVERDGFVIFGSTECVDCRQTTAEDPPTVTIRSMGAFGSVEITQAGQ